MSDPTDEAEFLTRQRDIVENPADAKPSSLS